MRKIKHDQAGFGAIEIIIVIVVIAVAGFAGWTVHKNSHKKPVAAVAATHAPAPSTAPTNANAYTGWQSYCDTINNGCFKYPNNWTLTTSNANGLINVQVSSPGNTASAMYKSYISGIGGSPQTGAGFYTASTNDLNTPVPALKVVGGYFTSSNIPYFYLVNASSLSAFPLTASQTSQFEALPDYNLMNSANFGAFYAYDSQKGASGSAAQAQAWYSTTDGQNALLIVKSFIY